MLIVPFPTRDKHQVLVGVFGHCQRGFSSFATPQPCLWPSAQSQFVLTKKCESLKTITSELAN